MQKRLLPGMIDHNEVQFIQFTTGEDREICSMTGRAKIFLIMTQSLTSFYQVKKRATEVALFRSQCHLNLFGDVSDQVQNFVGVTGFVVVPGYQFHEVVVQSDTSFSIEHGSANFAVEIGRYYVIFGVARTPFISPSAAALTAALICS